MWYCYGTITRSKHKGFFGEKEKCPNCFKTYSPAFVKFRTWAHVNYIPIFPERTRIYKMCPICGTNHELTTSEARPLMVDENKNQNITIYAKHILHNQPKHKWFDADKNYELWAKDNIANEEFCIATGLTKDEIKNSKKLRGLRRIEIITIK